MNKEPHEAPFLPKTHEILSFYPRDSGKTRSLIIEQPRKATHANKIAGYQKLKINLKQTWLISATLHSNTGRLSFAYNYQSPRMEEIRKIAKNQTWFRPIVDKAKANYKAAHKQLVDFDENKLSRDQFRGILEHISLEAELVPPTKEEAYELFDEFNDKKNGKMEEYLEKEEFEKFCSRVFEMLNSTIQN